jgi:hypothetical protein
MKLNKLRFFYKTAVRGVLSLYNGQSQAEGYLKQGRTFLTQIRTKERAERGE